MSKKWKITLISAGIVVAALVVIIALLPIFVRSKAVEIIQDETGRKARIEKVSINPFTLSLEVKGFAINASDGGPFISIANMRAAISPASIFKRALILSEVSVDTPAFTFARLAANNYSFNDIVERQKAKPKKESKGETRFSINNISVRNGSVDFDDRAVNGGRQHTVRNLEIAVPFISNIPYLVEKYTDPRISAVVDGANFSFSGKVKPLSKTMETAVHITLKQLDLPKLVAYAPIKPSADLASGSLNIDTMVSYRVSSVNKPELGIKGEVGLDKIEINLKNGRPLLKLPKTRIKASDLEVFARRFKFEDINTDGLEVFVDRDARGKWMYSQLLPQPAKVEKTTTAVPAKKQESSKQGAQTLLQVTSFGIHDGIVHFSDSLPKGRFKTEISNIDAEVKNYTTAPDQAAAYKLSLTLDKDTNFSVDGTFSLTPLTATANLELAGLRLQRGWPYLSQFLSSPLKGSIDMAAKTSYNKDTGVVVKEGTLQAKDLTARYGDKEGFDLKRFEINGADYYQKENTVNISDVKLSNSSIALSREADGSISLLSLLKKNPSASAPVGAKDAKAAVAKRPVASKKQPAKGFSYHLKKFQLVRFNAAFVDKAVSDKPRFTLNNTSLVLTNLNGPRFTPARLRFASTFNKSTPLKASGVITPAPFHYKGSVGIGRMPLRDFEAYFPTNINVFIMSGFADADMTVDIALKNGKPIGSFKGDAGIRAFHAIDTIAEEDLLKWESLQLDDIQGNLEPFSLALRQIALNGVYSRIIIRKDGTLNLQNLVENPKQDTPATGAAPAAEAENKVNVQATAKAQQQPAPARQQIRIGAVTIQDGTLSFTDNHLPQHFTTTFYNLGGRISGLSSEESKFADVDLRGNLENHSPLQITGQINPLRDDLFVDLKVSFRDIELSPVTPYSGTFLGYTIEKGKLFLDLKYHIDKKKLDSDNKIFIDQFTFGDRVNSDQATKLPVKLGLALLKDRKGEIHLDVPVTGRTDDPKFSVWRLVFQVLKNIMVKAVTSPFSLLSSMFGGGQDFSAIQFNYGTSTLQPQEEQKLNALAKALLDRPALKVELKGYVDREKDAEQYRRELLNRKLRNEKFLALGREGALKEGETADTIQVAPGEIPKYLSVVYKKEKFPKPRNVLGLVKTLPPAEMEKLIIANTMVGVPELQTLAQERVAAVMNYLVRNGKVPAERIFMKKDDVFKAPENEKLVRSRVELNAIVQ